MLSIAQSAVDRQESFVITHPFHPLVGREFALLLYRFNWGEDRVYFRADDRQITSIPSAWTNIAPPDPFVIVAAGRAHFRLEDLVSLATLLEKVSG